MNIGFDRNAHSNTPKIVEGPSKHQYGRVGQHGLAANARTQRKQAAAQLYSAQHAVHGPEPVLSNSRNPLMISRVLSWLRAAIISTTSINCGNVMKLYMHAPQAQAVCSAPCTLAQHARGIEGVSELNRAGQRQKRRQNKAQVWSRHMEQAHTHTHPVWSRLSATRSICRASFLETENPSPRNARRSSCQSSAPDASESHCTRRMRGRVQGGEEQVQ